MGAKEILARGEDLARRAVELWPGPINAAEAEPEEWAGWKELHAALLAIPVGSWTTYGALAALIGSHPVPVGNHLATRGGLHGAHRVLTSDGRVSPSFRWTDGERDDDPRELLEQEGVPFDSKGRANPAYRLSAEDLAALLDKELTSEEIEFPPADTRTRERAARFEELLTQNQPHAAEAVLQVLRHWEQISPQCRIDYGRAAETSAFPMMDTAPGKNLTSTIWPLALYPVAGVVEVVFQHLRLRPPFDDTALRKELMDRLNAIDGIELPEAKLELRPSFPMDLLALRCEEIEGVLGWFFQTVAFYKAQQE
ncbi:MGMT family protein [Streptacidiphilus monticola]